jgi:hypothetical protein
VTSQQDQIQLLIADIERALGVKRPQKPWVRASDMEPQRQALERAQHYLKSLQESFNAPGGWGPVDPSTGQIASQTASQIASQTASQQTLSSAEPQSRPSLEDVSSSTAGESAEDVMQALLVEMKFLKSSALEPLRLEMESLREKRDRLQAEVENLDAQRHRPEIEVSPPPAAIDEQQLNQLLMALMERLQENLSTQVNQTLNQLQADNAQAIAKISEALDSEAIQLRPSGQLEELSRIQTQSDQLLINIDTTLQRMFETLQRNIDSYQISLNEGIENMHSLGRQGEGIVRSLVDQLTQQLGQSAPPEPVFFPLNAAPSRSLALDEATADQAEATPDTYITPYTTAPETPATVSSLDQVLPSEALAPAMPDAENFIREDGTIDLDLLKLDIDRSEEDTNLSLADLTIDAATADAQAAASEFPDAEIEAKVTPTADAAYLADLTFDDLTIDPAIADLADEYSIDSAVDSSIDSSIDGSIDGQTDNQLETQWSELQERSSAEAAELAAVLPDLGIPPADAPAMASPISPVGSAESALVPDIPEADDDLGLGLSALQPPDALDDRPPAELVAALAADSQAAEYTALNTVRGDLDQLTSDLEETTVSEAAVPPPTKLSKEMPTLDSALIPDSPEGADEPFESLSPAQVLAGQVLEEQLGDRPDFSFITSDEITSDESAQPLDLQPPDLQPPDLQPQFLEKDPFEASLLELEESIEETVRPSQDDPTDLMSQAEEPLAPVDFDDDLDFYGAEDLSEASASGLSDEVSEEMPLVDLSLESQSEIESESQSEIESAGLLGEAIVEMPAIAEVLGAVDDPAAPSELPPITLPEAPLAAAVIAETATVAGDLRVAPETIPQSEPYAAPELAQQSPEPIVEQPYSAVDSAQPPLEEGQDDFVDGQADWFLGIDLGTTGLSAVLMNQRQEQVYPLCWNVAGDTEANRFRLPAVIQIDPQSPQKVGAIGPIALQHGEQQLRNLKPLLKIGIPHGDLGEPWVQWSDQVTLPLSALQIALGDLFKTLSANRPSCRAVGLKDSALRRALAELKGVIVGYPYNWPDTYSFNVREAVLAAGLIARAEQVFFVEDAIASLLSTLPDPKVANQPLDTDQQPGLYNCNWSGGTVVISAGATLTEAAIAYLPSDLDQLSYGDFALRSFTYGGDSLDQDIICQLLLPEVESAAPVELEAWQSLGLDRLNLPQAGEADRIKRHRLRQRLNNSSLGCQLVAAARELKLILQEESQFELTLGTQSWVIKRKDLESKVFLPYIQRVNRQVNGLLSQKGMSAQAVKQVVCTGGSASLSAIARWLRQKFPNATIIQDTYSGEYSNSCSRVAYGLANLCHYPQVLDIHRHQYNDYFLLLELLRVLPDQPLPAGGILHLLEQRGINTQACQSHILALIEGHLPPGLVPIEGDRPMISAQSPDIATYQLLSELPLFKKQGGQIYIADPQQGERLRAHMASILATKAQDLKEPLTAELAAEAVR